MDMRMPRISPPVLRRGSWRYYDIARRHSSAVHVSQALSGGLWDDEAGMSMLVGLEEGMELPLEYTGEDFALAGLEGGMELPLQYMGEEDFALLGGITEVGAGELTL